MFKTKFISVLLVLLLVFVVVGCGQEQDTIAEEEFSINLGYVEWPGATVKTHVVDTIFDYLGYETEMHSLMQQPLFQGMEAGDIDAFLAVWLPTMEVNYREYEKRGGVEPVRVNLDETLYRTAVPEYVWEAGVRSMEDLHEYGEKFDHEIVGLEPGNDGNIIIQEAIEDDVYQLEDWELTVSSTPAMMSALERAVRNDEWIAFHGWKPHWMNVAYDIKYLDDPEGIWGDNDRVKTVVRPEIKNESPEFYQFLERFAVTSDIQNEWIYEYGRQERPADEVAEEWIKNNLDLVEEWVVGLSSVEGEDAIEVIERKVQ
ncbi:ABC transporter substrate-binding protein [Natroniella sp. ANB-PHB2]|uniref:ABC transporter substrate-binding protein n=1 Tax=Natroniella sp. ANB-PHB2 TaxID=3384444 RepID=UPI0038D51058